MHRLASWKRGDGKDRCRDPCRTDCIKPSSQTIVLSDFFSEQLGLPASEILGRDGGGSQNYACCPSSKPDTSTSHTWKFNGILSTVRRKAISKRRLTATAILKDRELVTENAGGTE